MMRSRWILNVAVVALIVAVTMAPALAWGKPASKLEGKVIAKTDSTLTILPTNTKASTQVAVAAMTKVTGQRRSFRDLAIGDTVRIQGQMNGNLVTAEQIDVVALAGAQVDSKIQSGSMTTGAGAGAGVSIGVETGLDLRLP